ncbi:MAG: 4Fe-4S binding protein [Anaerolineaceae bacterium]
MSRWRLIQPSTRAFIREARQTPDFTLLDLLHGYVYARWTYLYIAMGSGRHRWAKRLAPLLGWIGSRLTAGAAPDGKPPVSFADTYHGKVVPLNTAVELVSIHQEIPLRDLEQVIPYTLARDIVLKNPEAIVALDCPCRMAVEHPCLPMDVCLIVGEPFAGLVIEHHPRHARRITPFEAQTILEEEDARGHVHHAFFKDAMLGRFYAICNCCSCCCAAMASFRAGTPMLASSGYTARVDAALCKGCRRCEQICPFDAVIVTGGAAAVDASRCMGCGICVGTCKFDALELACNESRGVPLDVQALLME